MITIILIIHIFLALSIIIAVLLQKSEGGGLGIGGSGGGGGFMTARGTANLLTKITAILGACFFITSILLALLSSSNNKVSIATEVEKSIENNQPIVPTVPLNN